MRHLLSFICLSLACQGALAEGPWKFRMENAENEVLLCLDLYEESVDVPGMSMFGPMNGYLGGKGVYGVWMVTSFKIVSDKEAQLHLSNDQGSETQPARLTWTSDTTCLFEQTGGNVIKKAVNRKLVKIPAKLELRRAAR
ncbi:MAG: hypothetical protein LUC86_08750 [Prevotellaceae bacterium]|nr:hypothetical protein [Prevotellaceae bacterium]MCD8304894.1 hypothetical protein [Prevotellaceae bacterium]